jgi:hypothetical protein
MRRSYISPEYVDNKVYGTLNMVEESNFFGSKMLDIENTILIGIQDIIYYQNLKGEQIDYSVESSLQSYVYSPSTDKNSNHSLVIDESQPKYQLDKNTRWILTINLKEILGNYLFGLMKKYRTFEGLKNEMTRYNNVNVALESYITFNVLDRYKLKSVDLYITYKDLRSQSLLRYKNIWNSNITLPENKMTKLQTETSFDESTIKLFFNQEKPSSDYSFEYFFNINYEKL